MTESRKLSLNPRIENVREKKSIKVANFDLKEIEDHFNENLNSLKRLFILADELVVNNKTEDAKDIWRTQIVFLESALDYYMHEITKYGMNKIFNNEWGRTEKYNNYNIKLSDVLYVISNPEDTEWFVEHVNTTIMNETFLDYKSIRDQLNILGIHAEQVAEIAFYVQGCPEKTIDQLKKHLNRIYRRRNAIAHQSDRNHYDSERNDIEKNDVEQEIQIIEKIVSAINQCIANDDCRLPNDDLENDTSVLLV